MAKRKSLASRIIGSKSEYKGEKGKKKLIAKLVICVVVWVALLCSLLFSNDIDRSMNKKDFAFKAEISDSNYKVHFIDVGQGDSSLIQFPDGKNMLIDTGDNKSEVLKNLTRYLDSVGVEKIDYLILTHTDSDHIGNADDILEMYEVDYIYLPTVYSLYEEELGLDTDEGWSTKDTRIWSRVVEAAYNEVENEGAEIIRTFVGTDDDTPVTQSIVNDEYQYRVDFYAPYSERFSISNDYSPVIMVRFGDTSSEGENASNATVDFMFVGDLEKTGEQEFLDNNTLIQTSGELDCEVLKVGHHGSSSSSGEAFLNVVTPEYAVISCGKGNEYKHPHEETLANLQNCVSNPEIMRTDLLGSIVFGSGGTELVARQTSYNHVNDSYLEWKYFVIVGAVIIGLLFILVIKIEVGKKKPKKSV